MPKHYKLKETDLETGELQERELTGNYRVSFTSENSLNAFKRLDNEQMEIHSRRERYGKYYLSRIDGILRERLTYNELRLLLALQSFAYKMHTTEITHEDGKPVTAEELCRKAHVDISRGRMALASLIKRQLVDRERKGRAMYYYLNPFVFVAGSSISWAALVRFGNTKWAVMGGQ